MPERVGRYTLEMNGAFLLSWAAAAGKKESEGPLGACFDCAFTDDTMGQESWEKAEAFFGISLASEKEMTFIVAKSSQKKAIMESVMREAGMESKAKAIVFSLPVTDTALYPWLTSMA